MAHTETLGRRGERFGAAFIAGAVATCGRRIAGWLVAHGCPRSVASGVIWTAGLAILAILATLICLSAALALMSRFVSVLAKGLSKSEIVALPPGATEWRSGWLGHGLYDQNGWRVDPHDPNDLFRDS